MAVDGPRSLSTGSTHHRKWARTADTQRLILTAAEDAFNELGYSGTTVADVVERCGASVGSVYHHFGGKAELFMALWRLQVELINTEVSTAVRKAQEAGETSAIALFEIGARAYLHTCWRNRRPTALFFSGDGPPGFEVYRRERTKTWIRGNSQLLSLGDDRVSQFISGVYTVVISEAARSVLACNRVGQTAPIIEEAVSIIHRISADRLDVQTSRPPRS